MTRPGIDVERLDVERRAREFVACPNGRDSPCLACVEKIDAVTAFARSVYEAGWRDAMKAIRHAARTRKEK